MCCLVWVLENTFSISSRGISGNPETAFWFPLNWGTSRTSLNFNVHAKCHWILYFKDVLSNSYILKTFFNGAFFLFLTKHKNPFDYIHLLIYKTVIFWSLFTKWIWSTESKFYSLCNCTIFSAILFLFENFLLTLRVTCLFMGTNCFMDNSFDTNVSYFIYLTARWQGYICIFPKLEM